MTNATSTEPMPSKLHLAWWRFLLVGLLVGGAGIGAILVPSVSEFAASTVLGLVLVLVGIVKIAQSAKAQDWPGFVWQLLLGAVEIVGGILIYVNPFKGAVAVALLVAIVMVVVGLSQITLALRIRHEPGWPWLLVAGFCSLVASAILVFGFRFIREFEAGVIAGIALALSGVAYLVIALLVKQARFG